MSDLTVRGCAFQEIEGLRARHRDEAGCQIVRDSILPRGLAEPFLFEEDGAAVGYAGVWTEHHPGRVMELYLLPDARDRVEEAFSGLLARSGAREIEAQTNLPQLHAMLLRFAVDVSAENVLFEDGPGEGGPEGERTVPGVLFRRRGPDDDGPKGDWVLATGERVVAAGGYLDHYNPPYCDVYMEVVPEERSRGLGSYLVQELRRVSRLAGFVPAARCDVDNHGSRRALLRGGFVECGRIVAGRIPSGPGSGI